MEDNKKDIPDNSSLQEVASNIHQLIVGVQHVLDGEDAAGVNQPKPEEHPSVEPGSVTNKTPGS
jgi:hypothetical protein